MKTLILLIFFATSIYGQNLPKQFHLGLWNSTIDDIAEQNPNYNILRDVDVNVIKDSDGKIITVRKVSQYASLDIQQFQFYVRRKENEKYIFSSSFIASINSRKRTNLL